MKKKNKNVSVLILNQILNEPINIYIYCILLWNNTFDG
jgi:hypothetical protein